MSDYAGDISPKECWEMVNSDAPTVVVDVRTTAEWAFVGVPALPQGSAFVGHEWQKFPDMTVDPQFVDGLISKLNDGGFGTDAQLCFLCRSGVRSLAAARAMTAAGYAKSFNISGGFEGDPDGERHRGNVNGWKADGLPWQQQ